MDSQQVAEDLLAIRKRVGRCLESETASRQTALEDVDVMLGVLYVAVTGETR